jgi:hypothetical protein
MEVINSCFRQYSELILSDPSDVEVLGSDDQIELLIDYIESKEFNVAEKKLYEHYKNAKPTMEMVQSAVYPRNFNMEVFNYRKMHNMKIVKEVMGDNLEERYEVPGILELKIEPEAVELSPEEILFNSYPERAGDEFDYDISEDDTNAGISVEQYVENFTSDYHDEDGNLCNDSKYIELESELIDEVLNAHIIFKDGIVVKEKIIVKQYCKYEEEPMLVYEEELDGTENPDLGEFSVLTSHGEDRNEYLLAADMLKNIKNVFYPAERRAELELIFNILSVYDKFQQMSLNEQYSLVRTIERSCYNSSCITADNLSIRRYWEKQEFIDIYDATCNKITKNLDYESEVSSIYLAFILFSIPIYRYVIGYLTSTSLCPEKSEAAHKKLEERANQKTIVKTSKLFSCRCGSNETTFIEVQMQSADESKNVVITCVKCHKTWKI